MIEQLEDVLQRRQEELQRKQNENALMNRQVEEALDELERTAEKLRVNQEGLQFLEWFANSRRGAMKGKIESVITNALKLIYGPDYRVMLDYSMKNNRSSMTIDLVKATPQGDVRRDMAGFGGGVADTISVPMRLMVILGSRQTDRVCVLDECFKHIDPERVDLVGEFIRVLSDDLQFQVILCSHHELLQSRAERAWVIGADQGRSVISEEIFA